MRTTIAPSVIVGVLLGVSQATAAPPVPGPNPACGDHSTIVAALRDKYGEGPIAWGVHPDGRFLLEFFASPDGSSWTLVTTTARTGVACLSGVGKSWTPGAPAVEVDHIIPLKDGGDRFAWSNLRSLCADHHKLRHGKQPKPTIDPKTGLPTANHWWRDT